MISVSDAISSRKYYVYLLCDEGVPFYAGKGRGDRIHSHEKKVVLGELYKKDFGTKDYNPRKTRKIQKVLAANKEIEYKIDSIWETSESALNREAELITSLGLREDGGVLLNLTRGGTGGDTYSMLSPAKRAEISERKRMQVVSDATKEKIRISSTGRMHTEAAKSKISETRKAGNYGKPQPQERNERRSLTLKGRVPWNKGLNSSNCEIYKRISEKKTGIAVTPPVEFCIKHESGRIVSGVGVDATLKREKLSGRLRYLINGRVDEYQGWIRFHP